MRKKIAALFMFAVLFALLSVSVHAEILYGDKDKVNAYAEQNTGSKVLRSIKGGEQILVEEITSDQKWAGVLCEDGEGQTLGWMPMSDLSYTMPSRYCNHQWTEWTVHDEATCTNSGMMERSCPVCGIGEAKDIPAKGHSYGDWKVTRQATCTAEGQKERTCKTCGHTDTQSIEKKAHNYTDWTLTKQATCTSEGERTRKCRDCGYEERQIIEKLPHNYGDWTVLKEATCTAEGEISHTCRDCGYESRETVAMLPHDFEWKILVEATDHSSGTRTNVCKVCGYTEEAVSYDPEGTIRRGDRSEEVRELQQLLADQNYLNQGGADGIFGGGTEKAIMEFQNDQGLTVDGIAWPQTIRKLQHDYEDWKVAKAVTREEAGERVRTCKECGYEQHEVLEPAPSIQRGDRSETVRAVQQMLGSLNFDCGAYDGIYGQMLDNAYGAFAKENEMEFEGQKLLPSHLDALVNSWIASVPEDEWMGDGGLDSSVNLALTVTPAQDQPEDESVVSYNWSVTNLGTESCIFTALLLQFGEDADFTKDNFAMAVDGEELLPACENSVTGTILVNKEWGEGALNFTALAVSTSNGSKWISNVDTF